ncbi:MAG: class I SAM-dependent methyltransferase [Promethearchaeota archaeon]
MLEVNTFYFYFIPFFFIKKIELPKYQDQNRILSLLEVGCGTGALLLEIGQKFKNLDLYGIDIDKERIKNAEQILKKADIPVKLYDFDILGNNFKDDQFDIIVTNLVFLWINDISSVFRELYRILKLKNNGILIIFAEPDYGGMIEYPNTGLKEALISNLINEGADPMVGRKLGRFFGDKFGDKFQIIDQLSASVPWLARNNKKNLQNELKFFKTLLGETKFNSEKMRNSIESGEYFLYIPMFSFILQKV